MKNSQKGFASLIILLIIAVVAIGGGTYYISQKNKNVDQQAKTQLTTNVETEESNKIGNATSSMSVGTSVKVNTDPKLNTKVITPAPKENQSLYATDGSRSLPLQVILLDGKAEYKNGVVTLTETYKATNDGKNSAFVHATFIKEPQDDYINLKYIFPQYGDGDQLGIWLNDEQRFFMTGVLASDFGDKPEETQINVTDLPNGVNIITIALHSYGEVNAKVQVSGIKVIKMK